MSTYLDGMGDASLRQLECFVAVAEEGRFVSAARRLGMSQPPVSRLIHRLEQAVGSRLFDRSPGGARLTPEGQAMLGPVRRALAEVRRAGEAARAAADGQAGSLSLGFSSSAAFSALPDLVRRYRAAHPQVHLSLRELVTAEQLRDLDARLLDGALARGPISRPGISTTAVEREPFVAVLSRTHPLVSRKRVPLSALLREAFVLIPRHVAPAFYDAILQACRRAGGTPTVHEEVAEWHTIVGLVGAGLGVSMVPASLQRLKDSGATFRPLDGMTFQAELLLAYRSDDPSPRVRALVEVARIRAAALGARRS